MSKPDAATDKWGLTPLQILTRAWERVSAGTHDTARHAIGWDSFADREAGSPLLPAWHLFLDSHGFGSGVGGRETASILYGSRNVFGTRPNKERELAALGKAIAYAKRVQR